MKNILGILFFSTLFLFVKESNAQVVFPAGDGAANAVPIAFAALPYSNTLNNTGYTNNLIPFSTNNAPDVWFRLDAGPGVEFNFNTCIGFNNLLDSYIAIVGQDGSSILAGNDDACDFVKSAISRFIIPPGNSFVYLVVDGYNTNIGIGGFQINVSLFIPPTPSAASPQNFCDVANPTIASLSASGIGYTLKWHDAAVGGSVLPSTTALVDNTVYYVDETNGSGSSARRAVTVHVNPTPNVNAVANQLLCNGNATAATTFSGATPGTVFNWVNNTPSIGLPASGTGNIAAFTATNAGASPITASITATPVYTANGFSCPGTATTFTKTINPSAIANAVAPQVLCLGANTSAINFNSSSASVPLSSIVYNWTNNNTSIGLAASGMGNIPSFAVSNADNIPLVSTITVTPTFTHQGLSCVGTPSNVLITANASPTVSPVSDETFARRTLTTPFNFSSPSSGGTLTYAWTNDNININLPASGTGNIAPFITENRTVMPIFGNITVTPTFTNGGLSCVGTPRTFTITVTPSYILPLKLVSFTANVKANNAVDMNWSVTDQTNILQYEVERSSNGIKFEKIGSVLALSALNNTYQLSDAQPTLGRNYYRLKIKEDNGTFVYSSIVLANVGKAGSIALYPVPVNSTLTIVSNQQELLNTAVQIINSSGALIKSILLKNQIQEVDLSAIRAGIYFIKLADGSTHKVIKQ